MAKTYDSYKNSGIAWIGNIPSKWNIMKLGNFYSPRNEKVSDKDYQPLSVTMQGILPQLETAAKTNDGDNRKLVKKGDFAINSRSDRRGSCGISPYDGSVSLINTVLSPRGKMNAIFYNWLFHTSLFADEYYKWGHGIVDDLWTTKWSEMKNISVVVPSLSEQQSIATFLDEKCADIDSLISLQEEMITELQAYKQSVITEAVTKGLNPNAKMKDSGVEWIGEIPEGWSIVKINRIFGFLGGYAFNSSDYAKEITKHQVVRIGNVKNDELKLESSPVYISEEISHQAAKCKLKSGDILFTMTGTKGKRDYFYTLLLKNIHFQEKELYLNQRVGCFMPISNQIDVRYYDYLLKDKSILDSIFWYETGTANQGNLGIESINRTLLQFPPFSEQQAIASYLDEKTDQIDSLIAVKQEKIAELKDYKKSIIYEYVTGKKRV